MGARKTETGPLVAKQDSVSVKVYSAERTKNGRGYAESAVVRYELDGRRCRKACATLDAAKLEAATVAARLSRGTAATGVLSGVDLDRYRHAVAQAALVGVPLQVAIDEYVQARRLMQTGLKILEIVDGHIQRLPTKTPTVQEVVDEMIAERRRAKLSKFHIADLENRLTPFAGAMQTKITSLSAAVVRPYLEGLRKADGELVAPRTRLNTGGAGELERGQSRGDLSIGATRAERVGAGVVAGKVKAPPRQPKKQTIMTKQTTKSSSPKTLNRWHRSLPGSGDVITS